MKQFPLLPDVLIAASLALTALASPAQMGPPSSGIDATFTKLFGDHKTFIASADALVEGDDTITMPMELSVLDTRMRVDVDMTRMTSKHIPNGGEMMKSMGMERIITISQNDKKSNLLIVPGLKAVMDSPMSEDEVASLGGETNAVTTELGKETIGGHPCIKNKVVLTDAKGKKTEATVWNATDLKNFPVKLQMPQKGNLVTLTFKEVKMQAPEAKVFVAPEGYEKYSNMLTLMGAAMSKMMSGGSN